MQMVLVEAIGKFETMMVNRLTIVKMINNLNLLDYQLLIEW